MADPTPQNTGTIDLRQLPAASGSTTGAVTGNSQSQGAQQDPFGKFEIPESVKKDYPELVPLILKTESMNDDERQYWFNILPIMTADQVQKLREILANEQAQLQQIDKEYDDQMKQIETKHQSQWNALQAKEKRETLRAQEKETETAEKTQEEELLKKLGDAQ